MRTEIERLFLRTLGVINVGKFCQEIHGIKDFISTQQYLEEKEITGSYVADIQVEPKDTLEVVRKKIKRHMSVEMIGGYSEACIENAVSRWECDREENPILGNKPYNLLWLVQVIDLENANSCAELSLELAQRLIDKDRSLKDTKLEKQYPEEILEIPCFKIAKDHVFANFHEELVNNLPS